MFISFLYLNQIYSLKKYENLFATNGHHFYETRNIIKLMYRSTKFEKILIIPALIDLKEYRTLSNSYQQNSLKNS